jgi:hypothetical protein
MPPLPGRITSGEGSLIRAELPSLTTTQELFVLQGAVSLGGEQGSETDGIFKPVSVRSASVGRILQAQAGLVSPSPL